MAESPVTPETNIPSVDAVAPSEGGTPPVSSTPDQPGGTEPAAAGAAEDATSHPAAAPTDSAPASEPSLLEKFDAENAKDPLAPDVKPPEAAAPPAEEGAKPEGEQPPAEAAPVELPPIDYKYELPESLTLDDAKKAEVHAIFDDFRRDPAANAQKLIDLHNQEMQAYSQRVDRDMRAAFNETRKEWVNRTMADEELGGSGHRTALSHIAAIRDAGISSAKPGTDKYNQDVAEFNHFLQATGAGDHPAFLRLLHNLHAKYGAPSPPPAGIQPPPGHGQNPNNRRGVIYDHPRSPGNRQQ